MVLCSLLLIEVQDLAFIFINKSYSHITQYLPFLILTPLCYTISETTGVGISISKNTHLNIRIYLLNALVNAAVALLLVPQLGAIGAAVSAACAAVLALIQRTYYGEKYYKSTRSYRPMIKGLTVFIFAALANLFLHGLPIRHIVIVFIILVYLCLPGNIQTLKFLINYVKKLKKSRQ